MTSSIDDARRVKPQVAAALGDGPSIVGVGLTRVGAAYGVKVNLLDATALSGLPTQLEGVPLVYEVVGAIRKAGTPSPKPKRPRSR